MKKRTKKETPLRASRKDDKIMPDTKKQGWGQSQGIQTVATETVNPDGSRTIVRTGI